MYMNNIMDVQQGIAIIQRQAGESGDTRLAELAWKASDYVLYNEDTGCVEEWPEDTALRIRYIQAVCESLLAGFQTVLYVTSRVQAR